MTQIPIDEPITICDYDPAWLHQFEQEKAAILQAIIDKVIAIEHFVPGLAAKPIVDILIGLKHYPMRDESVRSLECIGYEYLNEAGVPGRLYFRKRQTSAFNIAAVEWNSRIWRDNLLLRDYLRSHPEEQRRYEQHKRAVIAAGYKQLLAYSEQKARIVSNLLKRAKEWAE